MNQALQPQKELTIDGTKYIVQLYAPTMGLTLHAKLLGLLGEPLIKVFGMFGGGLKGKSLSDVMKGGGVNLKWEDLDMDALGDSVQMLFNRVPPEDVAPLIKEILSTTFNGVTLRPLTETFEVDFVGKYAHLFKLVAQVVGVQYADFLSGIVKRASAGSAARAAQAAGATSKA